MNDAATETAAPAPAAPARFDPSCSQWCVHKSVGLGMVGETAPALTFHRWNPTDKALEASQIVAAEDLRLARASELPEHLGYTPQQLKDLGYL